MIIVFGLAFTTGSQAAMLGLLAALYLFGSGATAAAIAVPLGLSGLAAAVILRSLWSDKRTPAEALVAWGSGIALGSVLVTFGGIWGIRAAALMW